MGLFDLFKGGKRTEGEGGKKASPAAKWAERAGDKRAQTYDRQQALQTLADMGTADAAAALMKRFTFVIDPSITDQDEKEVAFNGVLRAGKDAVEPVRAFAARADSLAWPIKVLKALLDDEELIDELVLWLSRWDTEYSKFIDPKLQILVALEDYRNEKIRVAVEPYLEDVNEQARFAAVATTLAQDDEAAAPALLDVLPQEESVRVRNKIADGFVARGWTVPDERRDAVRKALPADFSLDGSGKMKRRSS